MSVVPDDMELPPKPDAVTNGQLYLLLQRINTQQLLLSARITGLEKEVKDNKQQVEDMVRTWSAARTMLNLIKLLGGTAVAVAALWGLARGVLSHFIPGSTP